MRPAYVLIICLVAGLALLGTGGTIGYFIGKGKCPDAVQVNELLLEQGRLQADIVERDSTVARMNRDHEALLKEISDRPSNQHRVNASKKRLHGGNLDSLARVYMDPIPGSGQ